MATQSPSDSTNPVDEKSQISEVVQPTAEIQQEAKLEAPNEISPKSVFVNSEPIREEQIQNAIKFLSHPRVRGSPVIHRRSFLERKGLTKEEIDEAFRRVPDPPPSTQTTATSQEGQTPSAGVQPQTQTQMLQPIAASPAGVQPSPGILPKSRFHWYHAVIAVSVLAASGAGTAVLIKNSVVPRIKSWVRRVVLEEETERLEKANGKPSLAEEAAAAAKAAAAAAADVAKASQEMMISRNQDKKYFEEFIHLLDVQVKEMKSMSYSISKLEGQTHKQESYMANQEDYGGSFADSRRPYGNGKADNDFRSVRSSSPPAPVEPSQPPHPKSYMDIMQMVQRGEKPSNVREINDLPPNPNQQPSNPRMAPRTKPWESASDNGLNHQSDIESSAPWWQRKTPGITETKSESQLSGSSQTQPKEWPQVQQRTWVPPQPPSVYMPEAAEAIRRPKPAAKIDQLDEVDDDQTMSNKSGATVEPERIEPEINDDGKDLQNNEIQEVQE